MKKVLITGALGFIGRHTIKLLTERGFKVFAVTNSDKNFEAESDWNIKLLKLKINLRDLLPKTKMNTLRL